MPEFARWIIGLGLAVVFAYAAAYNAVVFWITFIRKQNAPSWGPLVGGLSGTLATFVIPIDGLPRWWWVPLLVDYGTIPGLASTAVWYVVHRRRPRP